MTHRRAIIVVCLTVFISLVPSLMPAAAAAFGQRSAGERLAAGGPPPVPHGRWLEAQPPGEPFTAETLYSTPMGAEAPAPSAQGDAEATSSGVRRYLIIVKNTLYGSIDDELATYISDVEAEGLTIELIEISGGTAEDLHHPGLLRG